MTTCNASTLRCSLWLGTCLKASCGNFRRQQLLHWGTNLKKPKSNNNSTFILGKPPQHLVELPVDRLPGHSVHRQRPLDVLAVDGAGRADGLEDRALDALLEIVQCRREERVRRRLERGAAPI